MVEEELHMNQGKKKGTSLQITNDISECMVLARKIVLNGDNTKDDYDADDDADDDDDDDDDDDESEYNKIKKNDDTVDESEHNNVFDSKSTI